MNGRGRSLVRAGRRLVTRGRRLLVRARSRLWPRRYLVTGGAGPAHLPFVCASCACPTTQLAGTGPLTDRDRRLVPLCGACRAEQARATRILETANGAAVLLGVVAAPLLALGATIPLLVATLGAVLLAATPLLAWGILGLFLQPSPLTRGRSVEMVGNGLCCRSGRFARRILAHNAGCTLEVRRKRRMVPNPRAPLGPLVALVLTPFLHRAFHPELRVMNLTDSPLVVTSDGETLGRVEPSSRESPQAGQSFRVGVGLRRLSARSLDGRSFSTVARLSAGTEHLWAPGSPEGCFVIETHATGREGRVASPRLTPLVGQDRFFALPHELDAWFVPPSDESTPNASGGTVTVLRQRPCR
jgi:hypothetical protein